MTMFEGGAVSNIVLVWLFIEELFINIVQNGYYFTFFYYWFYFYSRVVH